MATHLYTSAPLCTKTTNKPLCLLPHLTQPRISSVTSTKRSTRTLLSLSAAASIEVKESSATAKSSVSKPLPFRVGHGFDLHRLEPGYPLIIGGINIPHDRGCEAHSDGNLIINFTIQFFRFKDFDFSFFISSILCPFSCGF